MRDRLSSRLGYGRAGKAQAVSRATWAGLEITMFGWTLPRAGGVLRLLDRFFKNERLGHLFWWFHASRPFKLLRSAGLMVILGAGLASRLFCSDNEKND